MLANMSKRAYYSSMTAENPLAAMYESDAALARAEARRAEVGRIRGLAYRALMWAQRGDILRLGDEYEDAAYLHHTGEHAAITPAE